MIPLNCATNWFKDTIVQRFEVRRASDQTKRNFALFPVLDRIAEITTHILNKREQLVR